MPVEAKVFVVDDEYFSREGIADMLADGGWPTQSFCDCEAFLDAYVPSGEACLVLDIHFPGMGGLELQRRLAVFDPALPVVVVSGDSAIAEAVQSMAQGATDFIEKPVAYDRLFTSVRRALKISREANASEAQRRIALSRFARLTPREREIMDMVLAGHPSKNIACDLGISQRTVENHRASIMQKTGAKSLPALARMAMSAVDRNEMPTRFYERPNWVEAV
jgi:two-component system CheB/CheR fusion protein